MAFEYPIARIAPYNSDLLREELKAAIPDTDGTRMQTAGEIIVLATRALTAPEQLIIATVVANHDAGGVTTLQRGVAALAAFLDSRVDDLQYAEYFYRLQQRLLDLWRDKPNLTDTTTEIYAALRADRDTNPDDAAMYAVFLWYAQRTAGVVLVLDDLPPPPLTALQAQAINQAAYLFMVNGVTMATMLILNLRLDLRG